MPSFSPALGLLRSLAIYYGNPLRHVRLARLYRPFIEPGDLVFDVGAHVGNHARVFLRLGARVVAFEPQPVFARFLKRTLGDKAEMHLLEIALGADSGKARMYISSRSPTVSTISGEWKNNVSKSASFQGVRWDKETEVEISTLDACIRRFGRPKLIKLDVEGSEIEILHGLSTSVPLIIFETMPPVLQSAHDCLDRLVALGYNAFNWTPGEKSQLQAIWVPAEDAHDMLASLPMDAREQNIFARSDDL